MKNTFVITPDFAIVIAVVIIAVMCIGFAIKIIFDNHRTKSPHENVKEMQKEMENYLTKGGQLQTDQLNGGSDGKEIFSLLKSFANNASCTTAVSHILMTTVIPMLKPTNAITGGDGDANADANADAIANADANNHVDNNVSRTVDNIKNTTNTVLKSNPYEIIKQKINIPELNSPQYIAFHELLQAAIPLLGIDTRSISAFTTLTKFGTKCIKKDSIAAIVAVSTSIATISKNKDARKQYVNKLVEILKSNRNFQLHLGLQLLSIISQLTQITMIIQPGGPVEDNNTSIRQLSATLTKLFKEYYNAKFFKQQKLRKLQALMITIPTILTRCKMFYDGELDSNDADDIADDNEDIKKYGITGGVISKNELAKNITIYCKNHLREIYDNFNNWNNDLKKKWITKLKLTTPKEINEVLRYVSSKDFSIDSDWIIIKGEAKKVPLVDGTRVLIKLNDSDSIEEVDTSGMSFCEKLLVKFVSMSKEFFLGFFEKGQEITVQDLLNLIDFNNPNNDVEKLISSIFKGENTALMIELFTSILDLVIAINEIIVAAKDRAQTAN